MTNSKKDSDLTTQRIIVFLNELAEQPEKIGRILSLLLNDDDPDIRKRLAEFWTIVLLKHGDQIGKVSDEYKSELKELRDEALSQLRTNRNLVKRIDNLKREVDILTESNVKLLTDLKRKKEDFEKEIEDKIREEYKWQINYRDRQIEKLLKSGFLKGDWVE